MSVTNNIRNNVIYLKDKGWSDEQITNEEIIEKLKKEEKEGFLSFSYGCWVCAGGRKNLIENIIKLDSDVLYVDTDSIKVRGNNYQKVIDEYNNKVKENILKVCKERNLNFEDFAPKDKKGNSHLIGIFENDGNYSKFIHQGAKKYAYIDKKDNEIHITVAGVPKKGSKALKSLKDFTDDFVFRHEDTGKNLLIYNDEQPNYYITDYQGNVEYINAKYGAIIIPTTYVLSKSSEYAELISDSSEKRQLYNEGGIKNGLRR